MRPDGWWWLMPSCCCLEFEQRVLAVQATDVSRELARRDEDAVAGDDNRDRRAADGGGHGANAVRSADCVGENWRRVDIQVAGIAGVVVVFRGGVGAAHGPEWAGRRRAGTPP